VRKIVIYIDGKRQRRTKRLALGLVKLRLGPVHEQGSSSQEQGEDTVIQLTETQQVKGKLTYAFQTKKGNPAQVQEGSVVVTLTTSDPAVEASYDPATSDITVKGKQPGVALVSGKITADADLNDDGDGSGIKTVTIEFPVEAFSVSAGQAVGGSAGVVFGPPEEQPEA
jgi:hypothetical protein